VFSRCERWRRRWRALWTRWRVSTVRWIWPDTGTSCATRNRSASRATRTCSPTSVRSASRRSEQTSRFATDSASALTAVTPRYRSNSRWKSGTGHRDLFIQGAPIKKTIPYEKFIISVTVTDFFTKFTAFTEDDSGHIRSKFCYNICYGLKFTTIWIWKYSFLSKPVTKL